MPITEAAVRWQGGNSMAGDGSVVVIGGTSGIGLATAEHYAGQGFDVVISGRDADRAQGIAESIGPSASGIALDLAEPATIDAQLEAVGPVRYLVIAGIERDENTARDFDVARAARLVTMKLVGYTEVVHRLLDRLTDDASVVLFGGLAKDRPYPGSTNVTTVNGGITALVRTLAVELAPLRVNAIHPAVVGDTPYWQAKPPAVLDALVERTPTGRLVATDDVVHGVTFLLENPSVNGISLPIDGGWLLQ
jgi:NAD(P)-dependent dehydrogenase (short-subunit alcohol dehydrogenase family)